MMASIKTNSNSITAIFVDKLNYKKSGFRAKILKLWNLPDNTIFIDGTHSLSKIPEMENKEVDIIGKVNSKIVIMIEVKANLNEDLQDSQKTHGQYAKTVSKHKDIKLKYIIPDGYYHLYELPKESEQIQIITWTKIYEIAKEHDNTGFTEQIDYFVENNFNTNDLLLNKGDIAMFLSPSIIGKVNSLYSKIKHLTEGFVKNNEQIIFGNGKQEDFGWWYNLKKGKKSKTVWIGLCELGEIPKCSFFIYTWIETKEISKLKNDKYKNGEDFIIEEYETGADVYIPITDEDSEIPVFLFSENAEEQQKKFNELMSYNINKFFTILN